MKGTEKTTPFSKTAACPSTRTLLYFRTEKLSLEISTLVRYHLNACDFCHAELMLLAHYGQANTKLDEKTPEIPMNLRILAESILGQHAR